MSNFFSKDHNNIPKYALKMTKQKGIRMRVTARGELVVHANPFCSKEMIDKYVERHLDEVYFKAKVPTVRLFGRSFQVKKIKGPTSHVTTCEDELIIQAKDEASMEKVFQQFLRANAKDVLCDISEMIFYRFQEYSITMPKVLIRKMTSSWGICHPETNSITLNAELIHYPVEFIEYVVCHEFIHLLQPNHSPAFYDILKKVMPDYKRRIDLIETNNEKQYLM